MARHSYRVAFPGGSGFQLAGIIDRPDDLKTFPVVVVSHCFTCNKDLKAIVRIARALAEQGIGVLRFDMTGLGGSEGDFSATNFTTNLADLAAAIRFADGELGRVTGLLGHSFGGAAALAIAGQGDLQPPPVVATIAAPSDTDHLADRLLAMNRDIDQHGDGNVIIGGLSWKITHEMLADFRIHDLPAGIPKLHRPTLLFHSPVDETLSFDHAIRIMGLIQNSPVAAPPASLISLPDADHLLTKNAADIDFVADIAAAFFKRYADGSE